MEEDWGRRWRLEWTKGMVIGYLRGKDSLAHVGMSPRTFISKLRLSKEEVFEIIEAIKMKSYAPALPVGIKRSMLEALTDLIENSDGVELS